MHLCPQCAQLSDGKLPPDVLTPLIAAVERYLAAKGGTEDEWLVSFNALLKALREAKAAG